MVYFKKNPLQLYFSKRLVKKKICSYIDNYVSYISQIDKEKTFAHQCLFSYISSIPGVECLYNTPSRKNKTCNFIFTGSYNNIKKLAASMKRVILFGRENVFAANGQVMNIEYIKPLIGKTRYLARTFCIKVSSHSSITIL